MSDDGHNKTIIDLLDGSLSDHVGGNHTDFPELPNDIKIAADGGASLTLGAEGFVNLKASPLAQILLLGMMNVCRIVCREFEVLSDFGSIKLSNGSNGRCGLVIEGGADYGKESEPSSGTPTARFFMGDIEDSPDMRMGMMVNSTDNEGASGFFIGKDGKMRIATTDDYLQSIGSDAQTKVEGDNYLQITGTNVMEVSGKQDITLMSNDTKTVACDKQLTVAGQFDINVGGTLNIAASGINLNSMSTSSQPVELKCSSLNIVTG